MKATDKNLVVWWLQAPKHENIVFLSHIPEYSIE